jgi:hypothetical protein
MFTFSTFFLNTYFIFCCILSMFYSLYLSIIFIIFIYFYNSNIYNILTNWILFLKVYHKQYILSQITYNELFSDGKRYDYIMVYFGVKLLLTAQTFFIKLYKLGYEYLDIFSTVKISNSTKISSYYFVFKFKSYEFYESTHIVILLKNIVLFYSYLKNIIIALLLSIIYMIYTIYFFQIQFLKQLAIWFVIGMIFYWLISGFNFFVKHYQFGKFTSQIQRFWKRTNTYFWLIEGFLILLFFYYFLNSSQEPLYMYDYSALNQEYLVSLSTIYCNIVMLSFIIYLMYVILLQLNFTTWHQQSLYLLLVSAFIFFTFFLETYQFYYLLNSFSEKVWVFSEETNMWLLTQDAPIMRCKHYYLMVYLVAKYWHFLFIFLSWVFFMAKNLEKKKVTYVLFGANLQNLILLFILNLSCYAQWFKWFYRRFYDIPYKWFFISSYHHTFLTFFNELWNVYTNIFSLNINVLTYTTFIFKSLSIWNVDSLFFWKYM